jgi:hypothetical protein
VIAFDQAVGNRIRRAVGRPVGVESAYEQPGRFGEDNCCQRGRTGQTNIAFGGATDQQTAGQGQFQRAGVLVGIAPAEAQTPAEALPRRLVARSWRMDDAGLLRSRPVGHYPLLDRAVKFLASQNGFAAGGYNFVSEMRQGGFWRVSPAMNSATTTTQSASASRVCRKLTSGRPAIGEGVLQMVQEHQQIRQFLPGKFMGPTVAPLEIMFRENFFERSRPTIMKIRCSETQTP